jgi:hypothetical protein
MAQENPDQPSPAVSAMESLLAAFQGLGPAVRKAASSFDRFSIAEHPDLDDLNHELNNLYGGAFNE